MTRHIKLAVNDESIDIDYFVEGFIDHTISGMIKALEGTGEINELKMSIEGDDTNISLNSSQLPVNAFVSRIIKNTVTGMISSLKGESEINKIDIYLER
jgi:hypothetical protein